MCSVDIFPTIGSQRLMCAEDGMYSIKFRELYEYTRRGAHFAVLTSSCGFHYALRCDIAFTIMKYLQRTVDTQPDPFVMISVRSEIHPEPHVTVQQANMDPCIFRILGWIYRFQD
jgi:hypothetical protein